MLKGADLMRFLKAFVLGPSLIALAITHMVWIQLPLVYVNSAFVLIGLIGVTVLLDNMRRIFREGR